MITIKDCEAFCDADPALVYELACRERLSMVSAYARAHEIAERLPHVTNLPPAESLSGTAKGYD